MCGPCPKNPIGAASNLLRGERQERSRRSLHFAGQAAQVRLPAPHRKGLLPLSSRLDIFVKGFSRDCQRTQNLPEAFHEHVDCLFFCLGFIVRCLPVMFLTF